MSYHKIESCVFGQTLCLLIWASFKSTMSTMFGLCSVFIKYIQRLDNSLSHITGIVNKHMHMIDETSLQLVPS